jgi:hypothetical protein
VKILHNHVGYEANGSKHAVILGKANEQPISFRILEYESGKEVFSGTAQEIGPVYKWKDWHFWTVDFDAVVTEGLYCIEATSGQETIRSFPFAIQVGLLERNTLSNVLYYLKGQRCSGLWDKADRNMTFKGDTTVRVVDVHGGWFDATGDYGKHLSHLCFSTYFNPQQIPLVAWSLFRSYQALNGKDDPNFKQYKKRFLDEAMFGADYLVRVKNPTGSFYINVSAPGVDKKPEDRRLVNAMRGFKLAQSATSDSYTRTDAISPDDTYETSYRSGAGISIAALAMASTFGTSGDFEPADYLKAAEDAFAFLETHNIELTNDGKENIVDDYCALVAATELYKATHKEHYKSAADKRAKSLTDRLIESGGYNNYWRADDGDRPFFHAADAGIPVVSLVNFLPIADDEMKPIVLDAVEKSLRFELAITSEVNNPFGYSRQLVQNNAGVKRTAFFFPHDTETAPWWQGENARLASMATASRMAASYFAQDSEFHSQLQAFARNQLNWILGLNPFDMCMLDGSGHNNPEYFFFGTYQYTNAPGGICNGITSGFQDEDDIDFQVPMDITGQDSDWRWGEQWLPHAAWYLLAVAEGE